MFLTIELALTVVMLSNLTVGLRIANPAPPAERAIERTDILTASVTLSGDRYRNPDQRIEFHRQVRERLHAIPGTAAVSIASSLPLTPVPDRRLEAAGTTRFAVADAPVVSTVTIGSGYFSALGLPLIGGREFGDSQDAGSGPASAGEAIVNQRFADTYLRWQESDRPIHHARRADPFKGRLGRPHHRRRFADTAAAPSPGARAAIVYVPVPIDGSV